MSIYDVIKGIVEDKKEAIMKEIEIITEGIMYLQLTQESLMASDTLSDAILEDTFECMNTKIKLESLKAKFKYICTNISNTDEVLDIYNHYGLVRSDWLENYKKGKA